MTQWRATARAADAARSGVPADVRHGGLGLGVAATVALGAAFLLAYFDTIQKLVGHWSSNDMYSYGFLVPAITGYLVWLRRDRLRTAVISPSLFSGLAVLAAGLALLVVGRVSATNLVEELSLPITIWGIVLLVLGRQMAQRLTFPLAYLFTMIPFWDVFTGRLHLPFQLYSAAMGVGALRLLDIPVFHRGVLIELPTVTLEVAQLCSGVNNLVAILCIGVPLTQYYVKGWPKRLVIVAIAGLIALVSNGIRVATVCLFAYYGIRGADGDIHGPFSLMRSLIISGVGFLILFWLISHFAEKTEVDLSYSPAGPVSKPRARVAAVILAAGLMVAAGTFEQWHAVETVPVRASMVGFPTTIGRWESHTRPMMASSLGPLDFDAKLLRGYVAPDGTEVDLFLGYLSRQTQGRELAGEALFSGLGLVGEWQPSRAIGAGRFRDAVLAGRGGRVYATYTYVLDGNLVADEYEAKVRTTWGALARRRNNGAIVIVTARLGDGESVETARERYQDFLEDALRPSATYLAGDR